MYLASAFSLVRREDAPRDSVVAGDFLDQLGEDGAAERFEAGGQDHEGAGAADDVALVVEVEVGLGGAAEVGAVVDDRQAADRDAGGDRVVARVLGRAAGVVAAVARDVDDVAPGLVAAALEQAL